MGTKSIARAALRSLAVCSCLSMSLVVRAGEVPSCPGDGVHELGPFESPGFAFEHIHMIGEDCPSLEVGQVLSPFFVSGQPALTVLAPGERIGPGGDRFLYLYDEVRGDFTADVSFAGGWAHAGIMVRQDCTPSSRYAFLAPSASFAHRETHGGDDDVKRTLPRVAPGAWFSKLRIVRCGNTMVFSLVNEGGLSGVPLEERVTVERLDWGSSAPESVLIGVAFAPPETSCARLNGHTLMDWSLTPGCQVAVSKLDCAGTAEGGTNLTWENPVEFAEAISIQVGGVTVKTVAGNATSVLLAAEDLGDPADGVAEICVLSSASSPACCSFCPRGEVYVNCGGERLDDALGTGIGDGRIWLEDSRENPSPFLESQNYATADFQFRANTVLTAPQFIDDPLRSRLFATERYHYDDIVYGFPVPRGDYDVTLLFAEGCCSEGCQALLNPEHSSGGCRVFDILLNGELMEDQFAQHVVASLATSRPLPNQIYGVALAMGPYTVRDTNRIEVVIDDLGEGSPPEEASIKGIAIWPNSTGPTAPTVEFHLGETTGAPGSTVSLPFLIRADRPSMGFSFSIDFDEELLQASRITQLWQRPEGTPYDFAFFEFDNHNDVPGNLGVDEGFLVGAAIICLDACDAVLPPGEDVSVLDFEFGISPQAGSGSTELVFQDGATGSGGPARNKLIVDGEDITPEVASSFIFLNGRVNIVPDVVLFLRGDANGDGTVDISDPQATFNFLFLGLDPLPCLDAADADDSGSLNITDPIRTLYHLFLGELGLPAPSDAPGRDPTLDQLGCAD